MFHVSCEIMQDLFANLTIYDAWTFSSDIIPNITNIIAAEYFQSGTTAALN
jgi:hypothetical protein